MKTYPAYSSVQGFDLAFLASSHASFSPFNTHAVASPSSACAISMTSSKNTNVWKVGLGRPFFLLYGWLSSSPFSHFAPRHEQGSSTLHRFRLPVPAPATASKVGHTMRLDIEVMSAPEIKIRWEWKELWRLSDSMRVPLKVCSHSKYPM